MRGSSLIVSCKLLSLFLNSNHLSMLERDDTETVLSILGYLFHPGTVVFGPWISFDAYLTSIVTPVLSISAIVAPLAPIPVDRVLQLHVLILHVRAEVPRNLFLE